MTIFLRRQSIVAGIYVLIFILAGLISMVWSRASDGYRQEEKREVTETERKEVRVSLLVAPEESTPKKTAKRAKPAAAPKAAKSQPTVDQFTQIVATYDELGLQSYLRALVRDAGSRIFIADMEQKELLAAVSLEDEEIHAPGSFAGLAVGRPRIVDDPEAKAYLTQARQQFGPGNYSLIVLFPQRVEEWLVRELGQKSRQAGINPTTLLRFEGKYEMKGQQLVLVITRAVQREGQQIPLSVRLHFKDGPKEVTRG